MPGTAVVSIAIVPRGATDHAPARFATKAQAYRQEIESSRRVRTEISQVGNHGGGHNSIVLKAKNVGWARPTLLRQRCDDFVEERWHRFYPLQVRIPWTAVVLELLGAEIAGVFDE
jgi:hypothetical protein